MSRPSSAALRRLATVAALALALPGAAAAKGKKGKKKQGPSYSHTVTVAPVMLAWPALQAEYEYKLAKRIGVGGYASVGRFQPRLLSQAVSSMMPGATLENHQAVGLRGNFFFRRFDRGVYLGLTARWSRVTASYTDTSTQEGVEVNTTVDAVITNIMAGPHLGYKLVIKPGITLGGNLGVGYGNYGAKATGTAEASGASITEDLGSVEGPGLVPFGVVVAGWSF